MKRELLTTHDAAQAAERSYATIMRWIERGYLKAVRRGRDWWIAPDDLARCKAERKAGRPKPKKA